MHQRCRHGGIVPMLAAFRTATHVHLVFENGGHDLDAWIRRLYSMDCTQQEMEELLCVVMRGVGPALSHMHDTVSGFGAALRGEGSTGPRSQQLQPLAHLHGT
jgi:hypothetical protein